jgi:hypothetical protein
LWYLSPSVRYLVLFVALSISQSSQYTSATVQHTHVRLDLEPLDLVLEGADLAHEVRGLVGGDGAGDDGAGDTAGAAESHLGGNVDVGNVLVLAEEGQVEEDGQGAGVGGQDDDLGDTAVEGLGGLVGALLQLAVVGGLLDEVEDLLGESLVGLGPCSAVVMLAVAQ